MPGVWKTPARGVRVSEEVWDAAKAAAARKGDTLTDVIVVALTDYTRKEALARRRAADKAAAAGH